MMKKQIGSLILISTLISGCGGPLSILSSTTGLAVSHNSYVKAYNGFDLMTTFATEKDIKTHLYETAKDTVKTAKVIIEEGKFKIYNKKYYSGNLTGENAPIAEVKEEVLVASITTEPKVEETEKQQTMAFTLCYLSFFLALAIGSFVFISTYGLVSLGKTKKTRKVKKKIKTKKKGRR
jgi:hypothetical protein